MNRVGGYASEKNRPHLLKCSGGQNRSTRKEKRETMQNTRAEYDIPAGLDHMQKDISRKEQSILIIGKISCLNHLRQSNSQLQISVLIYFEGVCKSYHCLCDFDYCLYYTQKFSVI
jgi:hypothetical protein